MRAVPQVEELESPGRISRQQNVPGETPLHIVSILHKTVWPSQQYRRHHRMGGTVGQYRQARRDNRDNGMRQSKQWYETARRKDKTMQQ